MPCEVIHTEKGTVIVCSRTRGRRCYACSSPARFRCDFALGGGKTCSRPFCGWHGGYAEQGLDYCEHHLTVK
jgi:hypothetical protein